MKLSILDRILFLLTGAMSGYVIAFGVEGFELPVLISFTIAFGILLIAGLLIIIIGYEILEQQIIVILTTLVPLGLAVGLILDKEPHWGELALTLALLGLFGIVITRLWKPDSRIGTIFLAVTHSGAGLTIFGLPIVIVAQNQAEPAFALISVGGALIGLGGLALMFIKMNKPILSAELVMKLFPWILTAMMFFFAWGLRYA